MQQLAKRQSTIKQRRALEYLMMQELAAGGRIIIQNDHAPAYTAPELATIQGVGIQVLYPECEWPSPKQT